jgi:DNA polymerase-3 subunit delta'
MTEPVEPDRLPGAPHPRETAALFGQAEAEARFLDAAATGRLHHAWALTGPKGVGKATLAWRIARHLIAGGDTLDMAPDHPVFRQVAALGCPQLFLCRRPWDDKGERLRTAITVDEVRALKAFFQLSAAEGGRRVAIVDAADELNTAAANALLKILEEPPQGAVLLLVSHRPAALLPTLRSRCRELRCRPLAPEPLAQAIAAAGAAPDPADAAALAALAGGSVGAAFELVAGAGRAR